MRIVHHFISAFVKNKAYISLNNLLLRVSLRSLYRKSNKNTPDAIPNRMCLSIWNAKATDEGAELTPDFFVPKKRVLRKSETRVNEGNNLRQRSEANDLPERQQNSRN